MAEWTCGNGEPAISNSSTTHGDVGQAVSNSSHTRGGQPGSASGTPVSRDPGWFSDLDQTNVRQSLDYIHLPAVIQQVHSLAKGR